MFLEGLRGFERFSEVFRDPLRDPLRFLGLDGLQRSLDIRVIHVLKREPAKLDGWWQVPAICLEHRIGELCPTFHSNGM